MTESPHSRPTDRRTASAIVFNTIVSIAVLGACLYGYSFLGKRARPKRSQRAKSPVTIVASEALRLHEGSVPIQANGVVVPLREIRLATEVAGRIIEQSENLRAGRIVDS